MISETRDKDALSMSRNCRDGALKALVTIPETSWQG
jgi:hypothetical protein